jgi:hypothetical protein
VSSVSDFRDIPRLAETKAFEEGFPMLVPGREYRGAVDTMPAREKLRAVGKVQDVYTATVSYYTDDAGPRRDFTGSFVLDMSITRDLLRVTIAQT